MAKFSEYIKRVEDTSNPEVKAALDMYQAYYSDELKTISNKTKDASRENSCQ